MIIGNACYLESVKIEKIIPFCILEPIFSKNQIMIASKFFDELVDFIASKSPRDVVSFKASKEASGRYESLVFKEKTEGLSSNEKSELENFEVIEYIMRRAKAKAHLILSA